MFDDYLNRNRWFVCRLLYWHLSVWRSIRSWQSFASGRIHLVPAGSNSDSDYLSLDPSPQAAVTKNAGNAGNGLNRAERSRTKFEKNELYLLSPFPALPAFTPCLCGESGLYGKTVTGVPSETFAKKICAILPGIRIQPCEAGYPGR